MFKHNSFWITLSLFVTLPASSLFGSMSKLHGVIEDMNGARIPDGSVRIYSKEITVSVKVSAQGDFDVNLPSGLYSLSMEENNILPYRRGPFLLQAEQNASIIIRPVFKAPSDQNSIPSPILKYLAGKPNHRGLNVLVQYEWEKQQGATIILGGKNTALTYNYLTVYANALRCNANLQSCTSSSVATVDLEADHFKAESVQIDLSSETVYLQDSTKRKLKISKSVTGLRNRKKSVTGSSLSKIESGGPENSKII